MNNERFCDHCGLPVHPAVIGSEWVDDTEDQSCPDNDGGPHEVDGSNGMWN